MLDIQIVLCLISIKMNRFSICMVHKQIRTHATHPNMKCITAYKTHRSRLCAAMAKTGNSVSHSKYVCTVFECGLKLFAFSKINILVETIFYFHLVKANLSGIRMKCNRLLCAFVLYLWRDSVRAQVTGCEWQNI